MQPKPVPVGELSDKLASYGEELGGGGCSFVGWALLVLAVGDTLLTVSEYPAPSTFLAGAALDWAGKEKPRFEAGLRLHLGKAILGFQAITFLLAGLFLKASLWRFWLRRLMKAALPRLPEDDEGWARSIVSWAVGFIAVVAAFILFAKIIAGLHRPEWAPPVLVWTLTGLAAVLAAWFAKAVALGLPRDRASLMGAVVGLIIGVFLGGLKAREHHETVIAAVGGGNPGSAEFQWYVVLNFTLALLAACSAGLPSFGAGERLRVVLGGEADKDQEPCPEIPDARLMNIPDTELIIEAKKIIVFQQVGETRCAIHPRDRPLRITEARYYVFNLSAFEKAVNKGVELSLKSSSDGCFTYTGVIKAETHTPEEGRGGLQVGDILPLSAVKTVADLLNTGAKHGFQGVAQKAFDGLVARYVRHPARLWLKLERVLTDGEAVLKRNVRADLDLANASFDTVEEAIRAVKAEEARVSEVRAGVDKVLEEWKVFRALRDGARKAVHAAFAEELFASCDLAKPDGGGQREKAIKAMLKSFISVELEPAKISFAGAAKKCEEFALKREQSFRDRLDERMARYNERLVALEQRKENIIKAQGPLPPSVLWPMITPDGNAPRSPGGSSLPGAEKGGKPRLPEPSDDEPT